MTQEATLVVPGDDRLHSRDDDPYWNESSWISVMVPERGIGGSIYFYHRPNMKLTAGGPFLYDPTGQEVYDCLYWDFDTTQAMPAGAEMFDFVLDNSLTVRTIELGRKYGLAYERFGCKIDLVWEAIMDSQTIGRRDAEGQVNPVVGGWVADTDGASPETLTVGHYATVGRLTGSIEIENETIPVDCFSARDRSWGPRRVPDFPTAFYLWSVESETDLFFAAGGADSNTPVEGSVLPVATGWYMRDGVLSRLVAGERRVPKRRDDGCPLVTILDAEDELGRTLHAEGSLEVPFKFTGYTRLFIWWNQTSWTWTGDHTGWGEAADHWNFRINRQYTQQLRARQGK